MEQERRDRNELVKRLEEKEREVKMAVERNKVEDAFRVRLSFSSFASPFPHISSSVY